MDAKCWFIYGCFAPEELCELVSVDAFCASFVAGLRKSMKTFGGLLKIFGVRFFLASKVKTRVAIK